MKISVITPNWNGARFLESCLDSVVQQRRQGVELEYIVVDGGSTDGSLDILSRRRDDLDVLVSEKDSGPADAINKGLRAATGDLVGWINADDLLAPGALRRVAELMERHPASPLCFGSCPIVDEEGREIRRGITRFKEFFFPLSSRFTFQCINYLSQPATFFRRAAQQRVGFLRADLKAAFDYEFFLRLWRLGPAVRVPGEPLAAFRWHASSISGRHFQRQFREEYEAARDDAGRFSPQALLHLGVRWGIVASYAGMAWARRGRAA